MVELKRWIEREQHPGEEEKCENGDHDFVSLACSSTIFRNTSSSNVGTPITGGTFSHESASAQTLFHTIRKPFQTAQVSVIVSLQQKQVILYAGD